MQTPSPQTSRHPKNNTQDPKHPPPLTRWSMQEIRLIALRLAQRRIHPSHIIAWSLWRRAHQAEAQSAHSRQRQQMQLYR